MTYHVDFTTIFSIMQNFVSVKQNTPILVDDLMR